MSNLSASIPEHAIHCQWRLSTVTHELQAQHQSILVMFRYCLNKKEKKKALLHPFHKLNRKSGRQHKTFTYLQPVVCLILRMAAIIWTIHASCPSITESSSTSPGAVDLALSYDEVKRVSKSKIKKNNFVVHAINTYESKLLEEYRISL